MSERNEKYLFHPTILVKIDSSYVDSDILDSLDGYEAYHDEFGNRIYNVTDIESILNSKDDEIEDLSYELSQFLEAAKAHKAEKILIIA